jgi:hypothetical protein
LDHFTDIWGILCSFGTYIFSGFEIMYHDKSGNPDGVYRVDLYSTYSSYVQVRPGMYFDRDAMQSVFGTICQLAPSLQNSFSILNLKRTLVQRKIFSQMVAEI